MFVQLNALQEQILVIDREIITRKQNAATWVQQQQWNQAQADAYVSEMLAVKKTLYSHKMLLETMQALLNDGQ